MLPNLYASDEDLLFGIGQEVLDDLRADSHDAGAMDYAFDIINEVCRMADGYMAITYPVPITAESGKAALRPHVVNAGRWLLLSRRCAGKYATEDAKALYEEARDYFIGLGSKKYALPGVLTRAEVEAASSGGSAWTSNTVEFPVGERRGF